MKVNMSSTDRIIRIVFAVIVAGLYFTDVIKGTFAYVLIALAAILLLTSIINFCPLYRLFGISTCKIKN